MLSWTSQSRALCQSHRPKYENQIYLTYLNCLDSSTLFSSFCSIFPFLLFLQFSYFTLSPISHFAYFFFFRHCSLPFFSLFSFWFPIYDHGWILWLCSALIPAALCLLSYWVVFFLFFLFFLVVRGWVMLSEGLIPSGLWWGCETTQVAGQWRTNWVGRPGLNQLHSQPPCACVCVYPHGH